MLDHSIDLASLAVSETFDKVEFFLPGCYDMPELTLSTIRVASLSRRGSACNRGMCFWCQLVVEMVKVDHRRLVALHCFVVALYISKGSIAIMFKVKHSLKPFFFFAAGSAGGS